LPFPLADDITDSIKRAVSIVDLIGEHVTLTRRGRTFKGLCPFHDDHNPSLDVDPERQRYRCWSCDAKGDIFDFVMNRERLNFREALEFLAQKARIALPAHRSRPADGAKQAMFELLSWAEAEFHRCLLESEIARPARDYVAQRGLSPESVRTFRLGFAPSEWEWLVQRARTRRFTPEQLERCGLGKRRQRGPGQYDLFRGRLMFPIRDVRGQTIAFGGRILPQFESADQPKYVNSPETAVFSKSDNLYGLDRGRDAIAKAKSAVVVEGYTDCIMSHQHGLNHVVGTLGTALGDRHVRLLKRYADRIVLVFDGDDAGQKAADRALGILLGNEVELSVLTLPGGLDPCDFLLQRGPDEFRAGLDSAVEALNFKLQRAGQVHDLATVNGRRQALDFVLAAIAALPAAATGSVLVTREMVLDRIGQRLGVPQDIVRRRLRELREQHLRRNSQRNESGGSPADSASTTLETPAERQLLEILLSHPSKIDQVVERVSADEIESPALRRIFEACVEAHGERQALDLDSLRLLLDDRELASRASQLAEGGCGRSLAGGCA
jgi:DNA primase